MTILGAIGSGVFGWRGEISGFSIDFQRSPYNTLALPCQRVMVRVCDMLYIVIAFHNLART